MIVDIAHRLSSSARFFYLDTDLLFAESHAVKDALSHRYGIEFDRYSGMPLSAQEEQFGEALWEREPDACCAIRKVAPMRRALGGVDCWVSGIRRADGPTRAGVARFQWDARFGVWKLNPLVDWSDHQVWEYIRTHDLPYNALHDRGYPSIGCIHCTFAADPAEASRSGRWAQHAKTECGIHD